MQSPLLYDLVQKAAGIEALRRRLAPILSALEPGTLVDVGAGTGAFYELIPRHVTYIPVDVDPRKLERLQSKHGIRDGIVASGTALPLNDASVDYSLCTNVAHHLSDLELDALVRELRRVTRRQLVFLDPVRVPRVASRLLWKIDQGSYPRAADDLVCILRSRFTAQQVETFSYLHTYLLFAGTPLPAEPEPGAATTPRGCPEDGEPAA